MSPVFGLHIAVTRDFFYIFVVCCGCAVESTLHFTACGNRDRLLAGIAAYHTYKSDSTVYLCTSV